MISFSPFFFQHPFITELNERSVRIQIKDQIDRMKRKKLTDVYDMSGSDEEGGSLDPPTVRKQGQQVALIVVSFRQKRREFESFSGREGGREGEGGGEREGWRERERGMEGERERTLQCAMPLNQPYYCL